MAVALLNLRPYSGAVKIDDVGIDEVVKNHEQGACNYENRYRIIGQRYPGGESFEKNGKSQSQNARKEDDLNGDLSLSRSQFFDVEFEYAVVAEEKNVRNDGKFVREQEESQN